MVAVRTSSLRMDSPVAEDGKLLVTEEYLDVLLRLANSKFVKNRERTDGFYNLLMRDVSQKPVQITEKNDVMNWLTAHHSRM